MPLLTVVNVPGKQPYFTLDGTPVKLLVRGKDVFVKAFSDYPLCMGFEINGNEYLVMSDFDDVMVRDLLVVMPSTMEFPDRESIVELEIPADHACLQYLHKLTATETEAFLNGL